MIWLWIYLGGIGVLWLSMMPIGAYHEARFRHRWRDNCFHYIPDPLIYFFVSFLWPPALFMVIIFLFVSVLTFFIEYPGRKLGEHHANKNRRVAAMMEFSKLVLVRHGEPLSERLAETDPTLNDEENHLTEEGRSQAHRLAAWLCTFNDVHVVSSPLTRAVETARIIAAKISTEVEIDKRLAERAFGHPTGTTRAESRRLQENAVMNPHTAAGDGESVVEHHHRVKKWLSHYLKRPKHGLTVVVAHGGTLNQLQYLLFKAPASSASAVFTSCRPGHYHLWTQLDLGQRRIVWRLDAVDNPPPTTCGRRDAERAIEG